VTLPPGQRAIDGFPRFGTHLQRPPPPIPTDPVIRIGGAVTEPVDVPLARLATLPRRELTADFHCVAGWSATDLHWEGVAFETFYRTVIEALLPPGMSPIAVVFGGLDGYQSIASIEDALAADVLIAEQLNGRPLDADHGAPLRLISPDRYGFVSTKHLCRIELHTGQPAATYHRAPLIQLGLQVVKPHPRARVWHEERHRFLPAWAVRPAYRLIVPVIRSLSARGRRCRVPDGEDPR
jgi:DMSO/TMAO reductase YedYZ molybdopterin-dependent catalytic subunit